MRNQGGGAQLKHPHGQYQSRHHRRLSRVGSPGDNCQIQHTGDTAAFGLESADPAVLRANNIGTDVEKTFRAIEIMNEVGGWREQGIPKLLPGLNFLHGLEGEGKQTMDLNLEFLLRVRDAGLMVRRINIRQVNPLGSYRKGKLNPYLFQRYKEAINKEINKPMLRRSFLGTLAGRGR